jgi:hypothetical protein
MAMITQQRITASYHRLLDRFGKPDEKSALDRGTPLELPSEAGLMNSAIDDARNPSAGTAYLRAALELAGLDQRNAETRDVNVVARLRERGVSGREIAHHRGLQSAQAAKQRYERLTSQPEVRIYAFRAADQTGAMAWCAGRAASWSVRDRHDRLQSGGAAAYSGRTLELRYGPVDIPVMEPHLRAYALVNGRRVATTAAVQTDSLRRMSIVVSQAVTAGRPCPETQNVHHPYQRDPRRSAALPVFPCPPTVSQQRTAGCPPDSRSRGSVAGDAPRPAIET